MIGEDLFPFFRLSFCPINSVLSLTEAFQFHEVPLINHLSQCLYYQCSVQEVVSNANAFNSVLHVIFYQVQCIWMYVEDFDLLGLKFYLIEK